MSYSNTCNDDALEVDQLTVNYDRTPALWDVSLSIPTGKLVGILGPNGAGKSTLVKAALGLVKPVSGHVSFFGQNLSSVRSRVAYVPQRESVDWDFPITVNELVTMGCYGRVGMLRWPSRKDREKVEHYLDLVGMASCRNRQINQLSGGQQQRAFLARALIQEADVYLMDEPFTGIDMATEGMLVELLKTLRDQGKTVLVVHHGLQHVRQYFDWVVMLNLHLVGCGPVEEVFTAENLERAYGRDSAIFDEAIKLSHNKTTGMV